jgi:hydroxyacylglutathione hydrolase
VTTRVERLRVGPIGENVYAVETEKAGILVDPGDDAGAILKFLEEKRIGITLIALTHGHLDHCAAIPELLASWKGEPPIVAVHPLDARYLGAEGEETNKRLFEAINASGFFKAYWKGMPEPGLFLNDGDRLPNTEIVVLYTPGHSAGSICLYDEGSGQLISGDTLFRDGVGRTDAPDSDPLALDESLARLATLPPDTIVFPGHGPRTTIGREFPGHFLSK